MTPRWLNVVATELRTGAELWAASASRHRDIDLDFTRYDVPAYHPAAKALQARSAQPLTNDETEWDDAMRPPKTSLMARRGRRRHEGRTTARPVRNGHRLRWLGGRGGAGAPGGTWGSSADAGTRTSHPRNTVSEGGQQ